MRKTYENIRVDHQLPYVHVENYNEKEESTCVEVAILIKSNCVKKWILVPIISILSVFVFPVFLYWKKAL